MSYCFCVWPVIWPVTWPVACGLTCDLARGLWPLTWPVTCDLHFSPSGFPWLFCFPKGDSVFTSDFFFQYNFVCVDFVQASNSKKLCLISFDSICSEKFDGNFVLCNTLYTGVGGGGEGGGYKLYMTAIPCCQLGWLLYKLWEHHFLVPDLQCSYFPLPPLVLTLFMQMIVCNLQKVKLSLLCPGKIGFFGPQSYCAGNIISWLYCYETMKHNCIHIHVWFRRGSTPVSTVLRKSVRFFIIKQLYAIAIFACGCSLPRWDSVWWECA